MAKAQSEGGTGPPFGAIHRHGFVRVAAASPLASSGDVAFNVDQALAAGQRGGRARRRPRRLSRAQPLLLCGRRSASSRTPSSTRSRRGIARLCARERRAWRPCSSSARRCAATAGSTIARWPSRAARILGVVPKSFLPNYREYYEKRWFASGVGLEGLEDRAWPARACRSAPTSSSPPRTSPTSSSTSRFARIIWAPQPPSTVGALAGALILATSRPPTSPSARPTSANCSAPARPAAASPPTSSPPPGRARAPPTSPGTGRARSTSWASCSPRSGRFDREPELAVADIDVQRLRLERMRNGTFNDNAARRRPSRDSASAASASSTSPAFADIGFERTLRRFPYVPNRPEQLDQDCYEAFNIQVQGLASRFQATSGKHLVIGVSGGLDSTHALIVAAKACDLLGLPRSTILGFTMPGFATGEETKGNAWALMNALGIVGEEIDIKPAARQMLADMGHPFAKGEPVYDITFENVQAGLRTDYLFRLANQRSGFVVGTGDLSRDRAGLVDLRRRRPDEPLRRQCRRPQDADPVSDPLGDQVRTSSTRRPTRSSRRSSTPRSRPSWSPPTTRSGMQIDRGPDRPLRAARFLPLPHPPPRPAAVEGRLPAPGRPGRTPRPGLWPLDYPEALKRQYDLATIRKWLEVFLFRFFQISQYKRSRHPQFAQGLGRRRPQPARRLARAERRHCRRPGWRN